MLPFNCSFCYPEITRPWEITVHLHKISQTVAQNTTFVSDMVSTTHLLAYQFFLWKKKYTSEADFTLEDITSLFSLDLPQGSVL